LVALAASLWGTDALLRQPLSQELAATTIVFIEHVVIVVLTAAWLPRAVRALRRTSWRTQASVLLIGAGSSAVATVLFTMAFRIGDPVTPIVLQKLQPLFVVLAAWVVLGERVNTRFPLFAVPALGGAWLLAFPNPVAVSLVGVQAGALAVGAAALWAAGTVLGRLAALELAPDEVTVLRFAVGAPAAGLCVLALGDPMTVPGRDVLPLVLLAMGPGLLALLLYYRGLRATPAVRATLAELAFPVTAAAIGVGLLDARLSVSQWCGFALVLTAVTALALHERVSRHPAVAAPVHAAELAGRRTIP
jgi:drug/metabolite transporter (DMT)-like permease